MPLSSTTLLFALMASSPASAVERSLDTQLVYPSLTEGSAVAVDTPLAPERWRPMFGAAFQVERMPIEYFVNGQPAGAAVSARNTLLLGGALAVSDTTTVQARIGSVLQQAGLDPRVSPMSSFGVTDLNLGLKSAVLTTDRFAFGPKVDLWLPIGAKESWMAERNVRYVPGLLANLNTGPVRILASTALIARTETDTQADFVLGSELAMGLGLLAPVGERLTVLTEATSRHGFSNFMKAGAENPIEAKGGLRYTIPQRYQVDLVAGSAVNNGYGAADLRVLVSLVRLTPPVAQVAPVTVEVPVAAPKVVEVELPEQEAVVEWQEGELAQVHHGKIVIREPIQFEFNTSDILSESDPVLKAVAMVLADYPQIEHLVIEGHASAEGTYGYNYRLSNSRAMSIWEALVEKGIDPERISFRGRGETVPVVQGESEEALARNRRVEFRILKVRDFLDVEPVQEKTLVVPWSGEVVARPKMGDKMLSADAHPILVEEFVEQPEPPAETPDASIFRQDFDDDEDALPFSDVDRSLDDVQVQPPKPTEDDEEEPR